MSDEGQMKLRLPAAILKLVKKAAADHRSTMNAEIVARLAVSFERDQDDAVLSKLAMGKLLEGVRPMTDAERVDAHDRAIQELQADVIELRELVSVLKEKGGL